MDKRCCFLEPRLWRWGPYSCSTSPCTRFLRPMRLHVAGAAPLDSAGPRDVLPRLWTAVLCKPGGSLLRALGSYVGECGFFRAGGNKANVGISRCVRPSSTAPDRLLSSSGLRVLLDCFCYGHTHTHRDVRVNNSYPSKSISDLPTLFTSASCGLARDGPGLRPERPGGKGAQAPATSGTLVCWLGLGGTARKTGGRLQAEGRWVSRDPL